MTDGCYMCEVRMYDEIDVHSFEFVITPKISIRDDYVQDMKYLLEQPIYSLYNNQERIEFFQKKQFTDDQDASSSIETLQSVLENKFINISENYFLSSINEKQFNHICSSLSKRIQTYSLSNHPPTMTKTITTNFSEEQTNSFDYDNTYFYSEESSKLDDISSLTSITSEYNIIPQNANLYSDTDDNSEGITFLSSDLQHSNVKDKNEDVIPSDYSFTGLVHAIKYNIISANNDNVEQSLSDYDNVNHYSEQNNTIRLSADIVSLNSSMTSSMQYNHCPMTFTDEQLDQQEKKRTDEDDDDDDDDDDDYIIIDPQKSIEHLTMMNNENEFEIEEEYDHDDEHFESTRLFDNGQHDGIPSDESQYSDDLRCPSDAIRSSCVSDNPNNTSSTLRQEAISLTKVRCKQRQNWIRSSPSNNKVDGKDIALTCLNANVNSTTRVQTTATMLLHKNSENCNKNENKPDETPSYGFVQLNHDHHSMKSDESIVSPLLKTNSTHDKDASSTNKKTNNFYLIHHQSSLIPIKDLLNKNLNSNIEIIQMDEEKCILEIVDGVLTLVPRDKSASNSDKHESEEQRKNSIDYQTSNNYDSPEREERSSSISTPSISEHEQEPDEISSSSSSSSCRSLSNKEEDAPEPFILVRDIPSKSPPLQSQSDHSADLLDLFSTPPVPLSNSNTNNNDKNIKNLLDDSLSSVSSYENNDNNNDSISESSERKNIQTSSPIQNRSKSSSSLTSSKEDIPPVSPTNTTSALTKLVKNTPLIDEIETDYPIPKAEPPPAAKPLNKARVNDFASLLSAVRVPQPAVIKKQETPQTNPFTNRTPPSPSRSEEQSYSSIPTASSDRDERESFHTVKSNNNSEEEQTKKHIDARYNEKVDDRKSIQINTSNIKALFEQKISDTNKALSQSHEHLLHLAETKQPQQQHKKVPVSYGTVKRNLPNNQQQTTPITNRRSSFQDSANMNKYTDHIGGAIDVVIEDKQPELGHPTLRYAGSIRHNNTEEILRPGVDSLTSAAPVSIPNGYYSESLIAREIRETKEKEEELKRQRKKCGLPEDVSAFLTIPNNNSVKPDSSSSSSSKQPIKSSSFLSNLDFFTSKSNTNEMPSPRRSTQNIVYDSHGTSSNDESKHTSNVVAQELNRFNDSGIPIIRTSSTNNYIHRSASNQNILSTQNTTANIIQREIEAIRAKEAELRQSGRIQRTSDDHSDPRKYQEFVTPLPKSHSANTFSTAKTRRNTDRISYPVTATSNGFLKPMNNNSSISSIRGKFPSPNPTAPVVSSSNKSNDYSKLSTADRLELEKRECQEREQELKKQRHSVTGATLVVNPIVNGDSGNVSQDEHDDDQERYFDKIERLKRTQNEKAHAPIIRPTKRLELSQKWEQMMANKNPTDDDN